jgi:hypothetical protein
MCLDFGEPYSMVSRIRWWVDQACFVAQAASMAPCYAGNCATNQNDGGEKRNFPAVCKPTIVHARQATRRYGIKPEIA